MQQIELAYGRGSISFSFDEHRFRLLASSTPEPQSLTDAEIGAAFDTPVESPALEDLISHGSSALIVVSDATRATGSAQIVHLLVRRLVQSGVSAGDIAIIFSTGIHRKVSTDEKRELLTPFIVQRIRTLDHDAYDSDKLVVVEEALHSPVKLNRALLDFSHIILTGAVGFHYFAGFTGGRKSICPGLASAQTIEATHMLALDFEKGGRRAGVGTGLLDGNAVHEECERIAALVNPIFSINSVVDDHGLPTRVCAGQWKGAHQLACQDYLAHHSVNIDRKREIVVASCGGWPYDINLIQAHKALDMASYACKEGGTIVLLAECTEGLGRSDFLKWFQEDNSAELERRLREGYEVNGQTAWSLLTKAECYSVLLVSDLPAETVMRMRMRPMRSLEEAMANLPLGIEGYVLPRGAAFLPLISG